MERYVRTKDSWIWWDMEAKQFIFSYEPNNYAAYPFDYKNKQQLEQTARRYTDMLNSMFNNNPIPVKGEDIKDICEDFLTNHIEKETENSFAREM